MERKTFSIGMKLLTEYFGPLQNKRAPETKTEALAAMYWQGLKDLSDGAFEQAVTESIKHISPHRYDPWPDVKELREFASSYRSPKVFIRASDRTQLPEFTQQQVKNAKEEIKNIIAGLSSGMQV